MTTDWNDGQVIGALVNKQNLPHAGKAYTARFPNTVVPIATKHMISNLTMTGMMDRPLVHWSIHLHQVSLTQLDSQKHWYPQLLSISNLTTDWNDGHAISALVSALAPGKSSTARFQNTVLPITM